MKKLSDAQLVISSIGYRGFVAAIRNFVLLKVLTNIFHIRFFERRVHNYKMILDLRDKGVAKDLMIYGTREKEHIFILQQEVQKDMAILDLGANIGYYSLMMAKLVGHQGKIYAVEPSFSNYSILNCNIILNDLDGIVDSFNIGISDRTGIQKFYQSEKSNWHTFYPHVHRESSTEELTEDKAVALNVMTIDEFLKGKRNIDLIRMDVEGYEVEILIGLIPTLQDPNVKPKILFETHQPRYDDLKHNMKEPLRLLFQSGYYVKILASDFHNNGGAEIYEKRGYTAYQIVNTDGTQRGLFNDIKNDDAIHFICDTKFVRTVLMERESL